MINTRLMRHGALAGVIGAALLMWSPLEASADPGHGNGNGQGKWWNPGKGNKGRSERSYRGREGRVQSSYRAPSWRDTRHYTGQRYWRSYRGAPVYREYISYRVRPRYEPVYGWRYYSAPVYYYPRHVVYVRPVRFYVAADVVIGGVSISGRYVDPGPIYGCNFCDARFDDFGAYEYHVEHCRHAPNGYRIEAEDWGSSGGRDDDRYDDRYDDGRYDDEVPPWDR